MKVCKSPYSAFVLFIIVLIAMVPALLAQEPGAPPAGAPPPPGAQAGAEAAQAGVETKVQDVAQVLALTPQQQSQLEPIVKAEQPKVQAIVHDPNLTGEEKAKKLEAVHKQTDPLVKTILNPTQYKQWEHIRSLGVEKLKAGGQ